LKVRTTLDLLAIGVVGELAEPTSLVLATPSRDPELRAAGATSNPTRSRSRSSSPWSSRSAPTLLSTLGSCVMPRA